MLTASGKFQQAQKVSFNKAMKASYKLENLESPWGRQMMTENPYNKS
jgi:hypothetical protein